ncbi:hypothetical protein GH714_019489 [Hevea brasiliensis]|uniref:SMP-LTD domain-containing protein n=1 Tax=Hevea brasiliensis TaxID=3981 RepID=A0A6A6MGH3_HEVBR|nr:hypothetical protein GH714_019489 [Hevea brasiliensis]
MDVSASRRLFGRVRGPRSKDNHIPIGSYGLVAVRGSHRLWFVGWLIFWTKTRHERRITVAADVELIAIGLKPKISANKTRRILSYFPWENGTDFWDLSGDNLWDRGDGGLEAHDEAVDIKLLGSLNRDDLKKICGDNFPEWISFPAFEQVKWLNKQLSKLWPFIADAATMVVKESVEPLLEDYRPPGITSLKFNKFSLGTVPPKIEGIRVQSLKKGQITMDIDFRWGGDPSIILGVEAALVASIPIQLKDLEVYTVIRVIFQLAEEIPCISAVVVALLSEPKPKIDYVLKAVGGSLTAIPGLSDMIDDTVHSIVTDMLQWPHRIVVPIGGSCSCSKGSCSSNLMLIGRKCCHFDILDMLHIKEFCSTSELELKPQGKLTVTVVKANELKNMEMIGKSDPYVVLYIRRPYSRGAIDCFGRREEDPRSKKEAKRAGVIGSTMDALDGAVSLVGSGVGMVGTGIGAGVGLVGTGVGLVGTGVGAGVGIVGSGIGAGVGIVGSGIGAVGSGLSKAGKFMGRSLTGQSSKRSGSTTPVNSVQENDGAKPL